jgi:hypothetical protein
MAFGIDDAIAAGLKIVDKFIPDPNAKIAAEAALRTDLQAWDAQQNTVNAAEASSGSLFTSGWRPMIGWVCAMALAYQYLLCPLGMWVATSMHLAVATPPKLDDSLWQLMFGMLGMGGLRTFEKIQGVASK